jgi:diguanylate cyclase (GGDEF)-like protein
MSSTTPTPEELPVKRGHSAMRRLRRHLSPLASETISPINLPPVRMGLLTKLQMLTVGLIFMTAIAITAFYFWQQTQDEDAQIRTQGSTVAMMLADLAEYAIYTNDRAQIDQILDSLAPESDIAYVAVLDGQRTPLAERRLEAPLTGTPLPPLEAALPVPVGGVGVVERAIKGRRYLELVAPVMVAKAGALQDRPVTGVPDAKTAIGFVRVGMTFERQRQQLRAGLLGGLSVVALLTLVALLATLLLTQRLVAPMRRLMRAARSVGAGRLDVYVPATAQDEMGLLTHAFNHMTQRLAESQGEVANYQRTLEDKVAQRTKELEIATAHAYKLAQHDILTGLPNRSLLNQRLKQILAQAQRDGTEVACLFLDFDHFKRINDTLGHDAGDQLLQAIAQRLASAVRESDTVARLGGDEFVVILPGLDPAHATFEVMTVLSRVRESFLAPFRSRTRCPR